jgi:hypothetical protein
MVKQTPQQIIEELQKDKLREVEESIALAAARQK